MNEYSKVIDEIYTLSLNPLIKLSIVSKITEVGENGEVKSCHNEYKTSAKKNAAVVIRRRLDYQYLLESTINGEKEKLYISPPKMAELLDILEFTIRRHYNPESFPNYFIRNDLIKNEAVQIQCSFGKLLTLRTRVAMDENGILSCIIFINSNIPIFIRLENIVGLYQSLRYFDAVSYVNSTISMLALMKEPQNRKSFVKDHAPTPTPPASGQVGRSFSKDSNNII